MAANLPEPRNTGAHRQPGLAPGHTQLILSKWGRPGSDEAHFSHQHVGELGKLVEVEHAKDATDPCDPRVAVALEVRAVRVVQSIQVTLRQMRAGEHRPELPAAERPPTNALSLISVENGTT